MRTRSSEQDAGVVRVKNKQYPKEIRRSTKVKRHTSRGQRMIPDPLLWDRIIFSADLLDEPFKSSLCEQPKL